MKAGKKLSLVMSILLVLNIFFSIGNIKVKAEGTSDQLKLNSLSVNKTVVDLQIPVELTVDVANTESSLNSEAYAVYVQKTEKGDNEKELTLTLGNDMKYHATIIANTSDEYGKWQLSFVTAQDNAGNVLVVYNSKVHENVGQDLSSGDFTVALDEEGPSLGSVTLSKNAAKASENVTINVAASDEIAGLSPEANLVYVLKTQEGDVEKEVTLKLAGGKYSGIFNINKEDFQEGLWQLSYIILTDNKENVTMLYNNKVHEKVGQDLSSANLLVDYTVPGKPVINVSTDKLTNQNVKVTIESEKDAKIEYRLNGQQEWSVYKNAVNVTENTIVEARATDLAGNISETSNVVINNIDKVAPIITVNNVEDSKTYINTSVIPKVIVDDKDATVTYKLDGKDYNGADVIWAVGNHTLVVTAIDLAGNKTEKTINFKIEAVITNDNDQSALIEEIQNLIENAKPGETIVVNAQENPVISTEIFKALKGIDKPISFTLQSQGVSITWTLNGKDIVDVNTSVDLTLNAVAPNKDIINKIDSNAVIFSFKNHGTLPAPMVVTLPVDTSKFDISKPLYFYYVNEVTKKTELVAGGLMAYKVGDKYFVDVTITHTSDYFLSAQAGKIVKTGSPIDMNVLVSLGVLLVVMGAFLFVFRKRRKLQ